MIISNYTYNRIDDVAGANQNAPFVARASFWPSHLYHVIVSGQLKKLINLLPKFVFCGMATRILCLHQPASRKQENLDYYEINPKGSATVEKSDELTKTEWMEKIRGLHMQRADMNRLIMNYLVTEGFKGAAEKFRIESGVQPSVDLDTLDERIKIRDAIQCGKIQEAIEMVNNLHPELLDCDRYLFFHLQQQHLIELIRQRNIEEALKYAQEQLAERGEENREVLAELERTLALLAFDEPEKSPFGDLLHPSHRQEIASEVNASILEMENRESTTPKIATLMRVMLWIQEELEKKKVKYPKMTDIATGTIEDPK